MQMWCKEIMWKFVESGIWGGGVHERDKVRVAAQITTTELFSWYSTRRQAFPSESLTQLSNLSLGMVGKANAKRLKRKAMETYGLLLLLIEHGARLPDSDRLRQSGQALARFLDFFQQAGTTMSPSQAQGPRTWW